MKQSYYLYKSGRLQRKDNTLEIVYKDNTKKSIPVERVDNIYVMTEFDFNTSLLNFLSQFGINIHFFNYYGFYTGTYYPKELLVSGKLLIKQVEHYNDKEKRNSNLNIIIEETDRLALLVNDILTLSKLQQSMDNLTLSEFDLILLIKNILKRFTIYEEKYGYNIIFKHTNIRKLMIKADQKKIEQVLYNLIINAINYTGSDMKVVINISKVNNLYKIEVIDSGKGIDTKDLDNIFDKYYKSEKKHKRNLYGTGLGLSIVKSIFILHDYKYGVDTKKGKGSSFYFYIPKVED